MSMTEEKRIIYQLMSEIIKERRELSKQYYDLKAKLDGLDKEECESQKTMKRPITLLDKEKIRQLDSFRNQDKTAHYSSFDRVSKNVVSILKQAAVPLSNKQILQKLNGDYELSLSLRNLSCNILPKMMKERSMPIQKACRGYWQYKGAF